MHAATPSFKETPQERIANYDTNTIIMVLTTPWLLESGGLMLHLHELIQFLVLIPASLGSNQILFSHLCLGLPKSIFPVGLSNSLAYVTSRLNAPFRKAPQQFLSWADSIYFLRMTPVYLPVKRLWLDITSCSCSNAQWSVGLNKSCYSSGLTQNL